MDTVLSGALTAGEIDINVKTAHVFNDKFPCIPRDHGNESCGFEKKVGITVLHIEQPIQQPLKEVAI